MLFTTTEQYEDERDIQTDPRDTDFPEEYYNRPVEYVEGRGYGWGY